MSSCASTVASIRISGPLGAAIDASLAGRLSRFIKDPESEPAALFDPAQRVNSKAGDWYGEHAGKWLIAATRAARRTGCDVLSARVMEIALCLCRQQEPDGYLGTYAPDGPRFTNPSAANARTWDVWVHAYAMLGLLEVNRLLGDPALVSACHRVYQLLDRIFRQDGRDICQYGNHQGLSSLIVIHPMAQLTLDTNDPGPAALALHLLETASDLDVVGKLLRGEDIAAIGTGKIYQLAWLLQGLAVLSVAAKRPELASAARKGWESIRAEHLTPGGGPWGGIGRHKEVFNDAGYFSPAGMVETCSAMAWMSLNRALHEIEPDPRYPEEIERTLLNTVLGAADPNGEDWSYFTFPNGRRNPTYFWACCKSSGAIALEEAPLTFYSEIGGALSIDQFGSSAAEFLKRDGQRIAIVQETRYPADGIVVIRLESEAALGTVRVRVPSWSCRNSIQVDHEAGPPAIAGEYAQIRLDERKSAVIRIEFSMEPRVLKAAHTLDHHGQEIVRDEYFAVLRGPLVYAARLRDGFKKTETIRAPHLSIDSRFEVGDTEKSDLGPALILRLPDHSPIELLPYVDAGGRTPGSYRATWLEVAWQ